MDERRVRYPTGRNGDGTTHRVGLTRHCLASGAVHLPLALRDALPGGELLALDVERDEVVVLHSEPPRGLSGLTSFFEAHELQVNDQLEIRMQGGDVRLAAVRRARRDRPADGEERRATATSTWTSLDPSTWSPTERGEPRPPRPEPGATDGDGIAATTDTADVVERIGSVTVRRLGAGRFAAPPASPVARPAEPAGSPSEAPSEAPPEAALDVTGETMREPASEPASDAIPDATPEAASEPDPVATDEAFEALLVADPEPRRSEPASGGGRHALGDPEPEAAPSDPDAGRRPARPDAARSEADGSEAERLTAARADAGGSETARLDAVDARADAAADPHDEAPAGGRQIALFGSVEAPPAPGAPSSAAPSSAAVPAPGPSSSRSPSAPEPDVPQVREQDLAEVDARGRVQADVRPTARRRRQREESLSRAGDLRSRIVRWLLDPETPVIVPYERVQDEFGLDAQVTRDVLAGILEAPPPSLRLTLLREGMLRISRVTVEQQA